MRKWIDQSTFDELLLANAEDNIERAIRSASAVLETVQEFVPEAALFYRVTHAVDSLKNYFEEACTGFRRNDILFLVRQYFYPKPYYDLRFDWSFFRYADNYSYGKAFDKQTAPNRIGVLTKRRSTTGWNTSRRVSGISNGSMRRANANNRVPQPVGGSVRCGWFSGQKSRPDHS